MDSSVQTDQKFKPGDHVEFRDFDYPDLIRHSGVVLNYVPGDDKGYKGGVHIACHYVVPEDLLSRDRSPEQVQREYIYSLKSRGMTNVQVAEALDISEARVHSLISTGK